MKTRDINIKRRLATIDGFPMSIDDLISKLNTAKTLAKKRHVSVGFPETMFTIFNPTALTVQWDEIVPDGEPKTEHEGLATDE